MVNHRMQLPDNELMKCNLTDIDDADCNDIVPALPMQPNSCKFLSPNTQIYLKSSTVGTARRPKQSHGSFTVQTQRAASSLTPGAHLNLTLNPRACPNDGDRTPPTLSGIDNPSTLAKEFSITPISLKPERPNPESVENHNPTNESVEFMAFLIKNNSSRMAKVEKHNESIDLTTAKKRSGISSLAPLSSSKQFLSAALVKTIGELTDPSSLRPISQKTVTINWLSPSEPDQDSRLGSGSRIDSTKDPMELLKQSISFKEYLKEKSLSQQVDQQLPLPPEVHARLRRMLE